MLKKWQINLIRIMLVFCAVMLVVLLLVLIINKKNNKDTKGYKTDVARYIDENLTNKSYDYFMVISSNNLSNYVSSDLLEKEQKNMVVTGTIKDNEFLLNIRKNENQKEEELMFSEGQLYFLDYKEVFNLEKLPVTYSLIANENGTYVPSNFCKELEEQNIYIHPYVKLKKNYLNNGIGDWKRDLCSCLEKLFKTAVSELASSGNGMCFRFKQDMLQKNSAKEETFYSFLKKIPGKTTLELRFPDEYPNEQVLEIYLINDDIKIVLLLKTNYWIEKEIKIESFYKQE